MQQSRNNNNEAGRRPSQPILSEIGYRSFSIASSSLWALLAIIAWVMRLEISPSNDIISALAGSSVELAALSLTLLGILHELNKNDRWFKLGLLLTAISFSGVVFGGFILALTWQPAFDSPQQLTLVVVGS